MVVFRKFFYAGIGSRRINAKTSVVMMKYACAMAMMGGCLRSGGAGGSDTSFETGARIAYDAMADKFSLPKQHYTSVMEIYLPWDGFNGRALSEEQGYLNPKHPRAEAIAAQYHPGWKKELEESRQKPVSRSGKRYQISRSVKTMMTRNSFQVFGSSMDRPSRFVICETPDGVYQGHQTTHDTGGTGQAIRVADGHGIPVYNLKNSAHLEKVKSWIDETDQKLKATLGLSPVQLVDDFIANFKGIEKTQKGDLIAKAKTGQFDVIVHGVNCQGKMNSGIAKTIREEFPEAYQAYMAHRKGDKSLLGTFDVVPVERDRMTLTVINLFTQYQYGRDENSVYVDYEAVRKGFKELANALPANARIGIPKIGAGLANGCWVTLSNIIRQEMKDRDLTLVEFEDRPEPAPAYEDEQMQLFG